MCSSIGFQDQLRLYKNNGDGTFTEKTEEAGLSGEAGGLNLIQADFNNDGRLDLLLSTNGGSVYLFRNDAQGSAASNKSLRIKLIGTKSNRDGIGAVVRLKKGPETQYQMLHGGGYLSQNELVLTFGTGQAATVDSIDIEWPSGQRDHLANISADQLISVEEGRGISSSKKFKR